MTAPNVYPPITNSWPLLIRILRQEPERKPTSYRLSRRFATSPSKPDAFTDLIKSLRQAFNAPGISNRFSKLRQNLYVQ